MRVSLTVTEGPHQGKVFAFEQHDNFIVGRGPAAHFRLPKEDRFFSRVHFMVEVNPPLCRLTDMESTNGTFVNGKRVTTADLKDGDVIKGGGTKIRVSVEPATGDSVHDGQTLQPSPRPPATAVPAQQLASTDSFLSSRPRQVVEPATGCCVLCGGSLGAAKPSEPVFERVCRACQQRIREHPQPIDGFRIAREVGRGGMGVVYLAVREADASVTALKTIMPAVASGEKDVNRFLREAGILQQLDHPNIVAFREMGESSGQLYFAMDYVPGTDASHLLKTHGPLPIPRAVNLVCQLLEALEYAHAKGFVHRDIKPSNLLVTKNAGREVAKLADFGLARVYQSSRLSGLTMKGDLSGTVPFMAPEQITDYRGAKPAVDQYAAGATLYNLLTGRYIFDFDSKKRHQLMMILEEVPVPIRSRRKDIPEALATVIHRSLEREPADRFPDVRTMRADLSQFGSG